MSWQSRTPKQSTNPELSCRKILTEMGLTITASNDFIQTPFRDYAIQADFLVNNCLVIEVQSHYFHDKNSRHVKDVAKRECFTAMGYGVLWLWDSELDYADQVKRGLVWRPFIKTMILKKLEQAVRIRGQWLSYQNGSMEIIKVEHPEFGLIDIDTRVD